MATTSMKFCFGSALKTIHTGTNLLSHGSRLLQNKSVYRYYVIPSLEKKVFQRDKPHCNIGTIGHIGHGKTTLTAAITKVLAERKLAEFKRCEDIAKTPEEQTRGITIHVEHVEYSTESRHYGHTDCPGHVDFIKNMMIGSFLLDGAILVVAATEGNMPQTREHLFLAKRSGIEHIVVFINKADAADKEVTDLVEMEIKELMTSIGYDGDNVPVVIGSALCAMEGKNPEIGHDAILQLLKAVDEHIPTPIRDLGKSFLMPVENVFSVPNGTVVTGRLERGVIKKGFDCELMGYGRHLKSVVTGIKMFHKILDEARAGDQLSAMVSGVKKDALRRGMVLGKPGTMKAHDHVETQIYVLRKEEGGNPNPIENYYKPEMYSKTWDCTAQVTIPENEVVKPGKNMRLALKLIKPMVIELGQRFTLRNNIATLGTGVITKILPDLTQQEREFLHLSKQKVQKILDKQSISK